MHLYSGKHHALSIIEWYTGSIVIARFVECFMFLINRLTILRKFSETKLDFTKFDNDFQIFTSLVSIIYNIRKKSLANKLFPCETHSFIKFEKRITIDRMLTNGTISPAQIYILHESFLFIHSYLSQHARNINSIIAIHLCWLASFSRSSRSSQISSISLG